MARTLGVARSKPGHRKGEGAVDQIRAFFQLKSPPNIPNPTKTIGDHGNTADAAVVQNLYQMNAGCWFDALNDPDEETMVRHVSWPMQ
jgi:hypothetical protein